MVRSPRRRRISVYDQPVQETRPYVCIWALHSSVQIRGGAPDYQNYLCSATTSRSARWEPPSVRQTGVGRNVRSIRGRGAMGRQAGQRSPDPRVDDCQSGLRAPAAVIRGAGDGAFYREIPREMGRARLALSALDREAGGARAQGWPSAPLRTRPRAVDA